MSYILDALRKAERERRTRQTPRADVLYLVEGPARRSRRPWLLVGALLAVIALAAWLGWPAPGPVAPSSRPAVARPPAWPDISLPKRAEPSMKASNLARNTLEFPSRQRGQTHGSDPDHLPNGLGVRIES